MLTRDIKNADLYADCDIFICMQVGLEFKLAGSKELKTRSMAKVVRALYSLSSSGWNWHSHLAGTLLSLGFKPARYDQDVFMHQNKAGSGYDYVGCSTDNLLIAAMNAQEILNSLMKIYEVSYLPLTTLDVIIAKLSMRGRNFGVLAAPHTMRKHS